jgi:NAD(P)-dependent dehydrogenase (short-subunit alcohol dehydrogenase family)
LVTGAAGGIGRALALAAAARGMRVVATDIDAAALAPVVTDCLARGAASAEGLALDVRDAAAFEALAADLDARLGGVALLFCNAGVLVPRRLWEQTAREFDWLLDINLKGVANAVRAFLPRMIARGAPGHVVVTGSMGGFIPSPMLAAYSASKAAVWALAETLALDLAAAKSEVKVSLLAPGAVRTRIFEADRHRDAGADALAGAPAAMRDAMIAGTARTGLDPEEVARVTFEAVETGRFWIFPHPQMLAALPERTAAMVAGRDPEFDFARAFRR